MERRVTDPAHVPQLGHDPATTRVDRLGHLTPALDLLVAPQPGRIDVADALRRDGGRLGDDQPGAGALTVVLGVECRRGAALAGPVARQWGHDDPVGQRERPDGDGREQR